MNTHRRFQDGSPREMFVLPAIWRLTLAPWMVAQGYSLYCAQGECLYEIGCLFCRVLVERWEGVV